MRPFTISSRSLGSRQTAMRHFLPALVVLGHVASATAQGIRSPDGGEIQPFAVARRYAATDQPAAVVSPAPQTNRPPIGQCNPCWSGLNWQSAADPIYGGADYLLIRTHFSQAIAYVQATDSVVNGLPHESVQAREINFPYSSAFRTYVGYYLTPRSAVQLTYFHLNSSVAANGTPAAPNQFLVDAYGDRANFGQSIATNSSVNINAFDLDYAGRFSFGRGRLNLRPAAGARWADVRQHNDSTVTSPTTGTIGAGTFNTHFTGFGPHFSLLGQAYCRPNSPFSLVARGGASLLVGGFNNTSGAVFSGVAGGDQSAHRTLTVPVLEAELGGAWQPTENLMFSAGWLWQAWFDLGVSGGTTYSGKYAETDSASVMAFDGLFLRGMWRY